MSVSVDPIDLNKNPRNTWHVFTTLVPMAEQFINLQTSSPGPGKFVCNLCRQEFRHSRWLQSHMQLHANWIKANCKKQPQCPICQRCFKGPGMLRMHMKTHEKKPPEKQPTCKLCNKQFKSKTILYRHRQTHLEKHVQCNQCQKVFFSVSQLQSHQTKTGHERAFKCRHCDTMFEGAFALKVSFHLHSVGLILWRFLLNPS